MFCGNCGTKLKEGIEVCPTCGQVNQEQTYPKQVNQPSYGQQSYQQFQPNGNMSGQTWLSAWSQTHNLSKVHAIGIAGSVMMVFSVFMPLLSVSEFGYKESVTLWQCFHDILNISILGLIMIACAIAASVLYFCDKVKQALIAGIGSSVIGLFSMFAVLLEIDADYSPMIHLDVGGYLFFAGIVMCIVAQVKHTKG